MKNENRKKRDDSRSAWDGEDGGLEEVLWELDGVERGGGDDELHLRAQLDGLLQEAEEDVRRDGALVRLVQHDARVRPHLGVDQRLPEKQQSVEG